MPHNTLSKSLPSRAGLLPFWGRLLRSAGVLAGLSAALLLWADLSAPAGVLAASALPDGKQGSNKQNPGVPAAPKTNPAKPGAARQGTQAARPVSDLNEQSSRVLDSRSIIERTDNYAVSVRYPATGNKILDAELDIWAKERIRTFSNGVEDIGRTLGLKKSPSGRPIYTMGIDYELSEPSPNCISILFRVTTDMGEGVPETGILSFTYSMDGGRRLQYEDIFQDTARLFTFMSGYAQDKLLKRLGDGQRKRVLEGTAPSAISFECFVLTPEGLSVYFPPYQVAEGAYGEQQVSIPLSVLMPYKPNLALWGKDSRTRP